MSTPGFLYLLCWSYYCLYSSDDFTYICHGILNVLKQSVSCIVCANTAFEFQKIFTINNLTKGIIYMIILDSSPIYSHLSSTLHGLITVRAYNKESEFKEVFVKYQDGHSRAWIIFIASLRWNAFHLDLLCDIFITCTAFAALLTSSSQGTTIHLHLSKLVSIPI